MSTFSSSNGIITTDFGSDSDFSYSMILLADNKVLVAGISNGDIALARYNSDGSLDSSFGLSGLMKTDLSGNEYGYSIAVDSVGKIFVTGNNAGHIALLSYNSNGYINSNIGTGGIITTSLAVDDYGRSIAVQSDGSIVVAGYADNGSDTDFKVVRYNSSGNIDISFGFSGYAVTDFGSYDYGKCIVLQSNESIVVTGSSNGDFALVRMTKNGAIDSSFGVNGTVVTDFGGDDYGLCISVQLDGKIVVAGSSDNVTGKDIAIARYNADGSLDNNFAAGGKVTNDLSNDDIINSIAIQLDGKIVVAGYCHNGIDHDIALLRYNADGTLDTGFGNNGSVITDIGGDDYGYSVVIESDGKIVVAGHSNGDFALLRFTSNGTLDGYAGESDTTAPTISTFSPAEGSGSVAINTGIQLTFSEEVQFGAGKIEIHSGSVSGPVTESFDIGSSESLTITGNTLLITPKAKMEHGTQYFLIFGHDAIQDMAGNNYTASSPYSFTTDGTYSDSDSTPPTVSDFSPFEGAVGVAVYTNIQLTFSEEIQLGSGKLYIRTDSFDGQIAESFDVDSSDALTVTGQQLLINPKVDLEYGKQYFVTLDASAIQDLAGNSYSSSSHYTFTTAAPFINHPPAGAVIIIGSFVQGQRLTAVNALSDSDGLGAISYQWRSDGLDIADAIDDTYLLTKNDVGKSISVQAIYTDGHNTLERMNSLSYEPVSACQNTPPSFGRKGIVITEFGVEAYGKSVAIESDGSILVAGTRGISSMDFAIVKYGANGHPDSDFGKGGIVITDFGSDAYGQHVIVQADGKILVTGGCGLNTDSDFVLSRYTEDGSLDALFSNGGKVVTGFGGLYDFGRCALEQADAMIVVGGYSNGDFALVRYNSDGSLDGTFGTGGKVTTDFGTLDYGQSIARQADGKIVFAGSSNDDFALARYNLDGSLDGTFGTGGKVITDFGNIDYGQSVAIQSDGKIVVAGGSNNDFALARYNSDGSLDSSFGTGGKVTTDFGNIDYGQSVAIQADGKIVFGGSSNDDFALARYNPDGTIDETFGSQGVVTTDFGGLDYGESVAVQLNGKIVVAGSSNSNFAMARYNGDGSLDQTFGGVNTLNDTAVYVKEGPAVVLDSNIEIYDLELIAVGNFNAASLVLMRHGGANEADQFIAKDGGSLGELQQGGTLVVGGINVGNVTTNSGGLLTLMFNSSATRSEVNSVMQQIAYKISSDAVDTTAQIDWIFSDGNDGNGTQGTGGPLSVSNYINVLITERNNLPAGTVIINGLPCQGETLTAYNTLIDADLVGTISYQWYAGSHEINGATSDTIVLGQAQVGKAINVKASYTDGKGNEESVFSLFTADVENINDPPNGAVTISGTPIQGLTLRAENTLSDVDGMGFITYQWKADGTIISGATGANYTLTKNEIGKTITVTASYSDWYGATENVDSNVTDFVTADTLSPVVTVTSAIITDHHVLIKSNETGIAYIVNEQISVTSLDDIISADDRLWNMVPVTTINTDTRLSTTGLSDGIYKVYALDNAGNLSVASMGSVDITDTDKPEVSAFSPTVGATGVAVGTDIIITFSEAIQNGTGEIAIHSGSVTGTVIERFDVATSPGITISDTQLTLNPSSDLEKGTHYFVTFDNGSIKDLAGNFYEGTTSYNFKTESQTSAITFNTSGTVNGSHSGYGYEKFTAAVGGVLATSSDWTLFIDTSTDSDRNPSTFSSTWTWISGGSDTGILSFLDTDPSRPGPEEWSQTFERVQKSPLIADGADADSLPDGFITTINGDEYIGVPLTWHAKDSDNVIADFSAQFFDLQNHQVVFSGVLKDTNNDNLPDRLLASMGSITYDYEMRLIDSDANGVADQLGIIVNNVVSGLVQVDNSGCPAGIYFGNFTSEDVTPPSIISFSPIDGATGVKIGSNIVFTFNEIIGRDAGRIVIHASSPEGTIFESYDVATSSNIDIFGNTLTINPVSDLAYNTHYYITFESGSVKDTSNNAFQGSSTYDIMTAAVHDIAGHVTFWKGGAGIAGVTDRLTGSHAAQTNIISGLDGHYQYTGIDDGSYTLAATRAVGASDGAAVKANDALAALKIAYGINPNGAGGGDVSVYQFLAADVDRNGKVQAADALNILKMAYNMGSAPQKEWIIVPESVGSETMSRTNVVWPSGEIDVTLDQDQHMDLVGILKGDVNGSWVA